MPTITTNRYNSTADFFITVSENMTTADIEAKNIQASSRLYDYIEIEASLFRERKPVVISNSKFIRIHIDRLPDALMFLMEFGGL